MECIDQELQMRVWQRVQNAGEALRPGPEGLLLEERQDAALFRQLGHTALAEQAQQRAAVLQGICRLSGLPDATVLPKTGRTADGSAARRRIMESLLRREDHYEQLKDDRYGALYRGLADHIRKSATTLAAYMGSAPLRNRE